MLHVILHVFSICLPISTMIRKNKHDTGTGPKVVRRAQLSTARGVCSPRSQCHAGSPTITVRFSFFWLRFKILGFRV